MIYKHQFTCLVKFGFTDSQIAWFFNIKENELYENVELAEILSNRGPLTLLYLLQKEKARRVRSRERKQVHRRARVNEYMKHLRKTNPKVKVRFNVSRLVRERIKNRKNGVFVHFGYTTDQLMNHLQSMFVDGMNWGNYGKVWHIDHIKPDKLFKYESVEDEDFKKCWALSNLQPLFKADNLRKGSKYYENRII